MNNKIEKEKLIIPKKLIEEAISNACEEVRLQGDWKSSTFYRRGGIGWIFKKRMKKELWL